MNASPVDSGITLQQLAYFLSAVETGSLSGAAERHFIAQPSLSEQIRRLERQLGVTLFVRTNRSLILTDAARTLVPHAERTLTSARASVDAVAPVRELTGGIVTYGTFSTGSHLFHADLVERFHGLHPGVGVRLVSANSARIAEEVREGRIECAVVALPVDDRGLDMTPVEWSPETVYLSSDPGRTRRAKTMAELAQARVVMPEIMWGDTDPTRLRLLHAAQRSGLTITPHIEVDSPASALELAARGVADTIVTYTLAHHLGLLGALHHCSLDPQLREDFGIITRRHSDLSPAAEVLVGLTRTLLSELPEDGRA